MAGKEKESSGGLLRFLYNPDTGEVLGRTGMSWLKITVFYIIFYICLAAFWSVMLIIFYQTLDAFQPKWTLDAGLIGTVPGLGFRPRPPMSNIDSTLIYFKAGGAGTYKVWTDDLTAFFEQYERPSEGEYREQCSDDHPAHPGKTCLLNIENYKGENAKNCTKAETYGYRYGAPCVAIKINKIYGWKPEPYNINDFPANVPEEVRRDYQPNRVYITCEGENAADQENMGPVKFYPSNAVQSFYFPYNNVPGYMQPFVFAHFEKPEKGVLINVECKAWAANIVHDRQERIGSVHFEIMID